MSGQVQLLQSLFGGILKKPLSSTAPSPRRYVTIPITLRAFEIAQLDKLIQEKRFKELWKPGECNRISETTIALKRHIEVEQERLKTIERPKPLERKKQP